MSVLQEDQSRQMCDHTFERINPDHPKHMVAIQIKFVVVLIDSGQNGHQKRTEMCVRVWFCFTLMCTFIGSQISRRKRIQSKKPRKYEKEFFLQLTLAYELGMPYSVLWKISKSLKRRRRLIRIK